MVLSNLNADAVAAVVLPFWMLLCLAERHAAHGDVTVDAIALGVVLSVSHAVATCVVAFGADAVVYTRC